MNDAWIKAASAIVATLTSAGLVTGTGGAVLWARFHSSQLPADQAVAAVPSHELVVVGAATLVGFVIAGVGALVGVYALDHSGTSGPRTRRGLVVLMVVEIAVAIIFGSLGTIDVLLLIAAFGVAASILLLLLDDAASMSLPNEPDWLARLGAWLWAQTFAGVGTLERIRRGAAILVVALGVYLIARVDQAVWVVLWFAFLVLPIVQPWRAIYQPAARRFVGIAVLACGATALIRFDGSLAVITAAAVVLGLVNLGVAQATGDRFAFYGVCVFLSVVFFGGVLSYVRSIDHPKLQAVAVLLKGGSAPVCGLYVTETDSRLYLARVDVVAEGGQTNVVEHSGRMLSVPRSEIVRSDLGPLQSVTRAQERAAELRDELVTDQPASTVAAAEGDCTPAPRTAIAKATGQRALAERFQPRVVVSRNDGFWPISALTIFKLREHDQPPCRQVSTRQCIDLTRPSDLPWNGGTGEWIDYPGTDTSEPAQHRDMIEALGTADPTRTGHEYFFVTGAPGGMTTIQYWFYYEFNYQKLGFGATRLPADAGFHEGDWESVDVLLSRMGKPVYVWTARHNGGRPFAWDEPALERSGDHLTVHEARGSHASYESCGTKHRPEGAAGLVNDTVACGADQQLAFSPGSTPMSDIAYSPWACWEGRFGSGRPRPFFGATQLYFAQGPFSPLAQQKFGTKATPCANVPNPPARPPVGEEVTDEATASALRGGGGQLQGALDKCADWRQPPANGVYAVACDQTQLTAFFGSGLEQPGDEGITVGRPGAAAARTVPALYRHATPESPDGLQVSAAHPTTATVYVSCYSGEHAIERTFADVPLAPGQPLVLSTSGSDWTLAPAGASAPTATATPSGPAHCAAK
jgi:hypothetical protein